MFRGLKTLSGILLLAMCGCVSPEMQQAIDEAKEQRQAERDAQIQSIVSENYGTPDRALMFLGTPTDRTEGDEIFILEYQWSGCACSAIFSYDKETKEIVEWNIRPCSFHGWNRFGFGDLD